MSAIPVPDPTVREPNNWFYRAENLLSILALSAMAMKLLAKLKKG